MNSGSAAVAETHEAKKPTLALVAGPKKKTGARAHATSGQSGPSIKALPVAKLNKKERMLLGCFDLKGRFEVRTIDELAADAFRTQSVKKSNSWARNSLRRPIRAGLLEKISPGRYKLTEQGREALQAE